MRWIGTKRRGIKSGSLTDSRVPAVRLIFVRRVSRWAEEVARALPEAVLAEALASPTMRQSLATVLARYSDAREPSLEVLLEEAIGRGVAAKTELRKQAGGFKPTNWVAAHLGISRQAVDKRRRTGKLLAVEERKGEFAYPLCQFTPNGTLPGLEETLAAFRVDDPWERLAALVNPSPALGGTAVVDVLRQARSHTERERAISVVREFLQ